MRKTAITFLPINLNMCLGAQKSRLIETVLLSTHNICFGREIKKIVFQYTLIWRPITVSFDRQEKQEVEPKTPALQGEWFIH